MLGATDPASSGGVCFTLNRSPPKSSSLSLDTLHAGATMGRSSKYRKFFSKTKKKSVQDLPSRHGEGSGSSSNKGGLFQRARAWDTHGGYVEHILGTLKQDAAEHRRNMEELGQLI